MCLTERFKGRPSSPGMVFTDPGVRAVGDVEKGHLEAAHTVIL